LPYNWPWLKKYCIRNFLEVFARADSRLSSRLEGSDWGQIMKSIAVWFAIAAGLASTSAIAADMALKAPPAPPPPSPWDLYVTAGLMSDYNFRGVTQSNHQPSTQAGFEARYNFNKDWQGYLGVSGESIDFPNRAADETDFYGGIRPTLGKLALDFGAWYYFYPDGQCFNTPALCSALGGGPSVATSLPILFPFGNVVKQNLSFLEFYGKATYTVNDNWSLGAQIWGSPVFGTGLAGVLNSGASGIYYTGNITYTAPTTWFANGVGAYASADVGWWQLGTSDAFYAATPYTSYLNWDAGLGFTWKVFTLDLRYYQTNLTKAQCNAFTSDQTATFGVGNITAQNPNGLGSNWCGADFVAKLSVAFGLAALK
jgi:uncharacterized protein (TIGR02001 family)